jgi:hypothetical protein
MNRVSTKPGEDSARRSCGRTLGVDRVRSHGPAMAASGISGSRLASTSGRPRVTVDARAAPDRGLVRFAGFHLAKRLSTSRTASWFERATRERVDVESPGRCDLPERRLSLTCWAAACRNTQINGPDTSDEMIKHDPLTPYDAEQAVTAARRCNGAVRPRIGAARPQRRDVHAH